jgi:hypothetical protein
VGSAGYNLSGSFSGFAQAGDSLANGSASVSGTVGGMITSSGLSMTLTDVTNAQQSLALTFDNTYNSGSALITIAGNWTYSQNGFTLTANVQDDGAFSGSDSNNCSYNGTFSLIDPRFNTYSETHVRICNGTTTTFTGLAAFFPPNGSGTTATPSQLKLLSDDGVGDYLVADFQ